MQDNSYTHLVIIFLLTVIAANLFILDIKVFSPSSLKISEISVSITPRPTLSSTFPSGQDNARDFSCPQSCLSIIEQATKSSNTVAGSLSQLTANPSTTLGTSNTIARVARESYIPLGTGSTDKSSFADLTATETAIDPANYGTIKEAYFIASLKNTTRNGQVEAQLYNVTDKHPVWNSLVTMNGAESQTITSGKITLDTGNKLYRVQLKSTLNYTVSLDNAKIRIIAE